MVLPISLMSLEGLDVANVVFWVTWMYDGVTQKYDEGVAKKKGDWYVLCKGMLFPHIVFKIWVTQMYNVTVEVKLV